MELLYNISKQWGLATLVIYHNHVFAFSNSFDETIL